jgi:squalene synthase HpnD/squalene synthase HpnC
MTDASVTNASELRSGKTHRDENFPVASLLIRAEHRRPILAFYEFARVADDVADHPTLTAAEKIALIDRMETDLVGDPRPDANPQAVVLRRALAERGLSPEHAQDLLRAFRLDATKRRYEDWADLMSYCALSAMPVGRFVLDVHGESRSTWPASDAICAALQINNHLQDCGLDYRNLDRVYVPLQDLARHGLGVEALGEPKASPALRRCIAELAERTEKLLHEGDGLEAMIADWRLGLEIAVIHALALRIAGVLTVRDPLGEETHLGKWNVAGVGLRAAVNGASRRLVSHGRLGGAATNVNPASPGSQPDARARAAGSSFYMAMRLMPREQRQAMFEIYSFCREVDDIADNDGPSDVRFAQLQRWRRDVDAIYAGVAPPRLQALAEAIRTFGLSRDDLVAVIDGMEMDVVGPIRAPDWATLDLYCDRVASAVGRLSVRVFKMEEAQGVALAHHLGRALQLTNILRDIDEDAGIGRLYLPQEALRAAGINSTDPLEAIANPAIDRACAPVAARAERHFVESDAILAQNPRRVVRTPRIMSKAYRSILEHLIERGWLPPRAPVKLRRAQLIWIVLCHGLV